MTSPKDTPLPERIDTILKNAGIEDCTPEHAPECTHKIIYREAPHSITTLFKELAERKVLEARRDTISDMIIECYNHDDPMEIAKELENERKQLEAHLEQLIKGE